MFYTNHICKKLAMIQCMSSYHWQFMFEYFGFAYHSLYEIFSHVFFIEDFKFCFYLLGIWHQLLNELCLVTTYAMGLRKLCLVAAYAIGFE